MALPAPSDASLERFRRDLVAIAGEDPARIGIALSGGPDSLALLLLAAAAFPARVAAATVDHRLRAESGSEAERAAAACERLGVPHRTLEVEVGERPSVQAAARTARYAALEQWAAAEGVGLLLTGHHLDDQAETLLMRLLRGSGVGGLAGVRPLVALSPSLLLCRPLLGWRRSELAALVADAGLEPVDDPSNSDEAYDRSRIRRLLAETAWLAPEPLARSAAALADAEEALERIAAAEAAERISESPDAVAFDPRGLPSELVRRLLLRALRTVEPAASPRGEQLGDLIRTLERGATATLAGVKCVGGEVWRLSVSPPRRG